jgi:hypothetical protein
MKQVFRAHAPSVLHQGKFAEIRVVGWSSGMEEILGLPTQQALGRPCFEVLRRLRVRDPGSTLKSVVSAEE